MFATNQYSAPQRLVHGALVCAGGVVLAEGTSCPLLRRFGVCALYMAASPMQTPPTLPTASVDAGAIAQHLVTKNGHVEEKSIARERERMLGAARQLGRPSRIARAPPRRHSRERQVGGVCGATLCVDCRMVRCRPEVGSTGTRHHEPSPKLDAQDSDSDGRTHIRFRRFRPNLADGVGTSQIGSMAKSGPITTDYRPNPTSSESAP